MQTVLVNESFNNFSCIGGACEDSCCKGWNISIDKKTYNLYMTAADDTVMNFRENLILLPEEERTDYTYAAIKHQNGSCIFLSEGGLCKIHSRYGSPALSNVCNTFPRMVNLVNNNFELSWNTSCPEVVRYMLKNKKNNFYLADASNFLSGEFSLAFIYDKDNHSDEWQFYLSEIREFINRVFVKKELSIDFKLFTIGKVLQDIQQLINNNELSAISELLENINFNEIVEEFDNISANNHKKFILLYEISYARSINDMEYKKLFDSLFDKYDFDVYDSEDKISQLYSEFSKNSKAAMEQYGYFLENYISNLMMTTVFPLCNSDNIFFEFGKLLINYKLLEFNLIPYFVNNSTIQMQDLVDITVGCSKSISHDKQFLENVYDNYNINELSDLNNLIYLLK